MADLPPSITPPGAHGSWDFLWSLLVTKVAPALAGAYVRNLFPPRKAFWQRTAEALGGVLLVVYTGKVASGALWAILTWALKFIDAKPKDFIERSDANLLAAFLVGLIGMTIVEGAILIVRRRLNREAADA